MCESCILFLNSARSIIIAVERKKMRKYYLFICICIVVTVLASCSNSSENNKVLMIPREGSENLAIAISQESDVMLKILTDDGFEVIIATDSGKELKTGNYQLIPDFKLSEVSAKDYSGIIMPCMNAGTDPKKVSKEAIRIVKEAVKTDIPIAAQLGSVLVLEAAEVWSPDLAKIPANESYRNWGGDGIYTYNKIVTSGTCPFLAKHSNAVDRTEELTTKFIELLK